MSKNILIANPEFGNTKNQDSAKIINTLVILLNGIAHELRGDLSTITICTNLVEQQMANIKNRVLAANHLLTDLQTQVQAVVASEQSNKDFKLYSMAKNIEEALDQYYFQDNERDLITLDLNQDFEYLGNPNLTNHIISNLLKNALRAIRQAGRGKITIKLEQGAEFNKLIFTDTAMGISKEFLPKLFNLFESQNKSSGGTGIGLVLAKQIAESYGGNITCSSEEGEYTKFTLMLPCIT